MPEQDVTLPTKRKRAQINYADEDEELDALIFDRESERGDPSLAASESDEDDAQYRLDGRVIKKKKKVSAKRTKITKTKKKKTFPFMSLPAELRQQIYEIALSDHEISLVSRMKNYRHTVARAPIPESKRVNPGAFRSYYPGPPGPTGFRGKGRERVSQSEPQQSVSTVGNTVKPFHPNILAVSKQIHNEAIGVLYQQPLIFEDPLTLHSFLAMVGPTNCSLITEITLVSFGEGRSTQKTMNFCSLTLLSACVNLKSLFLNCSIESYRINPEGLARQLFREGYHFFEAYGTVHKRKDAAIDVLELSDWNFDDAISGRKYWARGCLRASDRDSYKERFEAELRRLLCKR